jgi:hypothetical protein
MIAGNKFSEDHEEVRNGPHAHVQPPGVTDASIRHVEDLI